MCGRLATIVEKVVVTVIYHLERLRFYPFIPIGLIGGWSGRVRSLSSAVRIFVLENTAVGCQPATALIWQIGYEPLPLKAGATRRDR
jgi:hypothetical protein